MAAKTKENEEKIISEETIGEQITEENIEDQVTEEKITEEKIFFEHSFKVAVVQAMVTLFYAAETILRARNPSLAAELSLEKERMMGILADLRDGEG